MQRGGELSVVKVVSTPQPHKNASNATPPPLSKRGFISAKDKQRMCQRRRSIDPTDAIGWDWQPQGRTTERRARAPDVPGCGPSRKGTTWDREEVLRETLAE